MLSDMQNQALKIMKYRIKNKEKVTVLQGFAGSGKTTTISVLIKELGYNPYDVHFCAFTGAAAKVMMDMGMQASTIHALIYNPIIRNGVLMGFTKKTKEEIEHLELIVVDEFSMVNQELLDDLISFDIPLLLVGDPAQLKPVGGRLNQYMGYSDFTLIEVHRQALDSPVLWAATKVREGEIVKEGTYGGKLFVGRRHQLDEEWLRKDVQIICGTNQTRHQMNTRIAGSPFPGSGDTIIFLRNHFEEGIVNGTTAKLLSISPRSNYFTIDFKHENWTKKNYKAYHESSVPKKPLKWVRGIFTLGYCLTAHKCQGRTLNMPMLIIDESYYFKDEKTAWIYTALTRSTGEKPVAWLR